MQYLFALLVLVAVVVCAMGQYASYSYNTHPYAHAGGYPYSYGAGYPYAYNGYAAGYSAYNPALSYFYKK